MKEELPKAARAADRLMMALLEENADALMEAFPDEAIVWYRECGYNLKENLHRLIMELEDETAGRENRHVFRRTGIYSAWEFSEELPFMMEKDAPGLEVAYEIGDPFCDGHMAWPFSVTIRFLDNRWRLDPEWILEYLTDE